MSSIAHEQWPDLIRSLRHPLAEIRCKAAKTLGRLGPQAAEFLPHFVSALQDQEPSVREAAAQAIGSVGPAAFPQLLQMCAHADKYVRRHAVWALGKLGPQALDALPTLCMLLKDVDPRTASGAAQALGALGDRAAEAVPMLVEAMRGTNIVLCRLAAKALSAIGTPAIPALMAHLRHSDPFVRGEAATALGWIGPAAQEALADLLLVLQQGRPGLLEDEPAAVPEVAPPGAANPTTEESMRASAAVALGRLGVRTSIVRAALRQAQRDPSEHVRRAVQLALKELDHSEPSSRVS